MHFACFRMWSTLHEWMCNARRRTLWQPVFYRLLARWLYCLQRNQLHLHTYVCSTISTQAYWLLVAVVLTEVMTQPPQRGAHSAHPVFSPNNVPLTNVEHFTYLGSVLSSDSDITHEVQQTIKSASAAFGRLSSHKLNDTTLHLNGIEQRYSNNKKQAKQVTFSRKS